MFVWNWIIFASLTVLGCSKDRPQGEGEAQAIATKNRLLEWVPEETDFLFVLGHDADEQTHSSTEAALASNLSQPAAWNVHEEVLSSLRAWHAKNKSPALDTLIAAWRSLSRSIIIGETPTSSHQPTVIYSIEGAVILRFGLQDIKRTMRELKTLFATAKSPPMTSGQGLQTRFTWTIDGLSLFMGFAPGQGFFGMTRGAVGSEIGRHIKRQAPEVANRLDTHALFAAHGLPPHRSSFIDFGRILALISHTTGTPDGPEVNRQHCIEEIRALSHKLPRILFGTTESSRDSRTARWVAILHPSLVKSLQRLRSPAPVEPTPLKTGFQLQINLNLGGVLQALAAQRRWLSYRPFACEQLSGLNVWGQKDAVSNTNEEAFLEMIAGLSLSLYPTVTAPTWGQLQLRSDAPESLHRTFALALDQRADRKETPQPYSYGSKITQFLKRQSALRLTQTEEAFILEFGDKPAEFGTEAPQYRSSILLMFDYDLAGFIDGALSTISNVRKLVGAGQTVGNNLARFAAAWQDVSRVRTTLKLVDNALVMDQKMTLTAKSPGPTQSR